jgi:hypothetical protein
LCARCAGHRLRRIAAQQVDCLSRVNGPFTIWPMLKSIPLHICGGAAEQLRGRLAVDPAIGFTKLQNGGCHDW